MSDPIRRAHDAAFDLMITLLRAQSKYGSTQEERDAARKLVENIFAKEDQIRNEVLG